MATLYADAGQSVSPSSALASLVPAGALLQARHAQVVGADMNVARAFRCRGAAQLLPRRGGAQGFDEVQARAAARFAAPRADRAAEAR